ncbi:hypothetical protein Tco_1094198 [Tanacetum coccineum]|uniref:Uncharacterized protein n=1 Tax=Tanacetum coccineum TaxID=301880 RepID=A0ABQ5IFC7_9ASTR
MLIDLKAINPSLYIMSQSIPEQLNVDRREFADAVNALTKICSSHLVGSGAGIFSSAIVSVKEYQQR